MTDLKFKAGDHVMVPMVVESALDGETPYRVLLRDYAKDFGLWVPEAALASATLIERPLAVGDRVLHEGDPASILGIEAPVAWIKYDDETHGVVPLSELHRNPA